MMTKKLISLFSILLFFACNSKQKVDVIITNAVVYTVDSAFSVAQSFAIKDGKFKAIGRNEDIQAAYIAKETIDAKGKTIFPGFIDAHCHFYAYGKGLQEVDLTGTKSFDEVIERLKSKKRYAADSSEWIIGRGWDQNDWRIKEFPTNKKIDSLFPNIPVMLTRIDGHAALVNSVALKKANITSTTKIVGGIIELKNKMLTGILIDNAVDLIQKVIPPISNEKTKTALMEAQRNCFAVGLTTVDDAGLDKRIIDIINKLQQTGELKIRIYAMLTDNKENLDYYLAHGTFKTDKLNVRSFKLYADGALGSRGACLMKPYTDEPMEQGFLLNKPKHFDSVAQLLIRKGFQMNTHCIGDSAVHLILNTYLNAFKSLSAKEIAVANYRWRIEHAQVVEQEDVRKFSKNILPSVQPTHATSDMYWAKDRLGVQRIACSYAYNDLLQATGMIALGTDFPVENINPIYTFYAAVARRDLKGFPEGGFQIENAISREEALKGMTIWAAYSNFEENEKGSIETGKFADFVILDTDMMKVDISKVPQTKVMSTYINGKKVY